MYQKSMFFPKIIRRKEIKLDCIFSKFIMFGVFSVELFHCFVLSFEWVVLPKETGLTVIFMYRIGKYMNSSEISK